jgi:hypothetical protein
VVGLVVLVAAVAVVLAVVCAIRLLRDTRRWRRGNPLQVLTVRQRRELLAAVRGRAPVDPSRAGLAHHVAEGVVAQRAAVARYVAIALDRVGVAITSPTRWQVLMAIGWGFVATPLAAVGWRDARRARRFLQGYPAPAAGRD